MIRDLTIRNWQSLRSVDLTLGRFTVVVGHSGSGKSALLRALRGLASNVRGTSVITRGKTVAAVTARTDTHKVTLEHGAGAWFYRVLELGETPVERLYTKLNAQVPEQVSAALGLRPVPTGGTSVNFASQFDPPFLLGESGAATARVLGELTNVDTLFAAVREANRRRAGYAATLKTRERDMTQFREQAATFADLKTRLAACERAETLVREAEDLQGRAHRLGRLVAAYEVARDVLARVPVLSVLPSAAGVDTAYSRLSAFQTVVRAWAASRRDILDTMADADAAAADELRAARELSQLLASLGCCPTCGQRIPA